MTKLRFLTLSFALALALTACTAGTAGPSPSVPATPSPSPSESLSPPDFDHLEFYDQFDRYNNGVDEHDFVISETETDGKLQYQFQNEEHDVTVFVSPRGKTERSVATLAYQEKTLEFEMPIFILGHGNVSGVASFHLKDLTGDGTPELIYIYGAGGTGVWDDNVKVFDLAAMTDRSFAYDPALLAEGLDVLVGNHNTISMQDGQLILTALYLEDESLPVNYAGSLSAPFVFDAGTGSFTLDTSRVTVTVFDDNT